MGQSTSEGDDPAAWPVRATSDGLSGEGSVRPRAGGAKDEGDQLALAVGLGLVEDVRQLPVQGVWTELERFGNLAQGEAVGQRRESRRFAWVKTERSTQAVSG